MKEQQEGTERKRPPRRRRRRKPAAAGAAAGGAESAAKATPRATKPATRPNREGQAAATKPAQAKKPSRHRPRAAKPNVIDEMAAAIAAHAAAEPDAGPDEPAFEPSDQVSAPEEKTAEKPPSRRRRRSRSKTASAAPEAAPAPEAPAQVDVESPPESAPEPEAPPKPKRRRRSRSKAKPPAEEAETAPAEAEGASAPETEEHPAPEAEAPAPEQEEPKKPSRRRRRSKSKAAAAEKAEDAAGESAPAEAAETKVEAPAEAKAEAEEQLAAKTASRKKRTPRAKSRRRGRKSHAESEEGEILAGGASGVAQADIIVNVTPRETRVAILEKDRLVELLVEREQAVVGNIYKGRVENVVPALDAAFVDCGIERNVFIHVGDAVPYDPVKEGSPKLPRIGEVLHKGQEIIVQVTKGPLESKGARATARLSLPGRYVVLTRDGQAGVGVSKKIEDDTERHRLRDIAAGVKPNGWGCIVRTRAQGAGRAELQADLRFLTKTWETIDEKAGQSDAPATLYEDLSLVFEILRDVVDQRVRKMVIDDRETHDRVLRLLETMAPDLMERVELYQEPKPVFSEYGVEQEIERALRPRVWLPHGGHLSIEETEALTVIDVNSGRFTSPSSLADTVLRTNLEAADEIGRQLRLRDIGGIIVIDFIDMDRSEHRDRVLEAMRVALHHDRMRTRVMHITRLGLMEMTRKRTDLSLSHQLQESCPWCNGSGRILEATTVATRIITELRMRAAESKAAAFTVLCEPHVALALIGPHGELVEGLEKKEVGRPVLVRCDLNRHREHFEIVAGDVRKLEKDHGFLTAGDLIDVGPEAVLRVPAEGLIAQVKGVVLEVPEPESISAPVKVRIVKANRSYARGTAVS